MTKNGAAYKNNYLYTRITQRFLNLASHFSFKDFRLKSCPKTVIGGFIACSWSFLGNFWPDISQILLISGQFLQDPCSFLVNSCFSINKTRPIGSCVINKIYLSPRQKLVWKRKKCGNIWKTSTIKTKKTWKGKPIICKPRFISIPASNLKKLEC